MQLNERPNLGDGRRMRYGYVNTWMDKTMYYVEIIYPRLFCNIQSYKAYKYSECSIMPQNVEVLILHITFLMIFFLPTEPNRGLYLETKLIPPICFHLSFVQRQSPQTIHKQKSDKKPITDTQLISSQKNAIQVDV